MSEDEIEVLGGHPIPSRLLRDLPQPRPHLRFSPVSRELALMLALHHDNASLSKFMDANLKRLPVASQAAMVAEIRSILGVLPIKSRTLGYVGPET